MKKGTFKKILRYISHYRASVAFTLIFAFLEAGLTLLVPLLVGQSIDLIPEAGGVDIPALIRLLTLAAASIGLAAVFRWGKNILNNRVAYGAVREIRRDAFRKIQNLPLKYLDSYRPGELVSKIITDANQFSEGLLLGFTQLFTGLATIIGTLAIMLAVNWKIALVVFLITPLSLFTARFIASKIHHLFLRQAELRSEQTAYTEEMVGNLKLLHAYNREQRAREDFKEINGRLSACSLKAIFFSSLTNPSTRFINSVVYAAVALCGGIACILNPIGFTVGSLTAFLSYANQYTKPFNEISSVFAEFQNSIACAARIFELLEEPSESSDENLPELKAEDDTVSFENVEFSYTKDKKFIEGLNLLVTKGSHVAIVGPTGCGKTTLINLIMRFFNLTGGKIAISGQDISEVKRESLRSKFGMVLQETWLKNGTVRENIMLSDPNATEEEMIAAAKASHAHSFIKRLPSGYDTVISEDGGLLSEGQKQLLCIARVMLSKPDMLILDEATSSIDTRTERKVQDAFDRLMEGRTSFVVAHRLSTIRHADIILVMKDGKIIETGNHKELMHKGGFYKELYKSAFERTEDGI